jgi:hypothetical protein
MLETGITVCCWISQLHVDGAVVDVAEQVVAGRVALEAVLEVAGGEVIDHKHHSHRVAVL